MDGIRGYGGWRWVFIIEGVLTSVVALILFFFIADFPEDVKWLNEEERTFMRAKLAKDVGKAAHHVRMGKKEVLGVFKDCKSRTISIPMCCSALTLPKTRSSLEA
jgi:sugar phosphate permease